MANFNCCFCGDFFRKRTSGKGYEKRPLSSTLRGRTITALRAMQMIYDYKVQLNFSFSNESSSVYRNTVADYNVTHIYIYIYNRLLLLQKSKVTPFVKSAKLILFSIVKTLVLL